MKIFSSPGNACFDVDCFFFAVDFFYHRVELAVFCTDTEQSPVAPLIVRRTGRVFGRSCPALLFRGTSPRLRKATWKLLCRIRAWSCTACNFFLFSCQGAFGAACSVDGAIIADTVSLFPEKKLRTVFCPQLFQNWFLNRIVSLLSQPCDNLVHQFRRLGNFQHWSEGKNPDQKIGLIFLSVPQMNPVMLLVQSDGLLLQV